MEFKDYSPKTFLGTKKISKQEIIAKRAFKDEPKKDFFQKNTDSKKVVDKSRRNFLLGVMATGAVAVGAPALKKVEDVTDTINKLSNFKKRVKEKIEEFEPFSSQEYEQTETENEYYISEEELSDEETHQIKNMLNFNSRIEFNAQKNELLQRLWRERYEEHILYKREFAKSYVRIEKHKDELTKIFSRYGVPQEFIYLSIPESYAKSKALSHKGAMGDYQFMKATAIQYGLRVDEHVDERTDLLKSATACARFLSDLYKKLGNWNLALYAYNGGFSRRYANQMRIENKTPSEEGFWRYMGQQAENIRQEMKSKKDLEYSITQKDTISSIAKKYAISTEKLLHYNKITNPRKVRLGQKIKIPLTQENREKIYNKKVSGIWENINYVPKCTAVFKIVTEGGFIQKEA